VIRFKTEEEALAIANDSQFGLVAYLWSEDLTTVMRCSREIRAGTIWVNTPMMRDLRAPFGGFKDSGIGRDGPQSSLDFFTELKATTIPIDAVKMHRFGLGAP
jgi:acyl-CoA reductase-like NAD-dependent aldehyde dehydrogenase